MLQGEDNDWLYLTEELVDEVGVEGCPIVSVLYGRSYDWKAEQPSQVFGERV